MTAILITGAASGIGAATAKVLAGRHAERLILVDRDGANLAGMAETLPCRAQPIAMDVTEPDAWERLNQDGSLSGLTGAVLCAGVSAAAAIEDMDFEAWRHVLSVNLDGAFLSLRSTLRAMNPGGAIVALASTTGRKAVANTAAYGASKAGLVQLVKTAALEAAPRQIRVNALAPGGVKTPMFSNQPFFSEMAQELGSETAAWQALAAATPLGRYAEPDEVARAAAWLLGPETALVTGAVIDLDGGYGI